MLINDLYTNKTPTVAEAIGDLGSKRDQGKTIRKWRKSRGLDEQGMAEGADTDPIWNQYGQYSVQDLVQEFPNLSPKDAQTIVNFAEYGWSNMPNRQEYRDQVVQRIQQAMSGQQGVAEGDLTEFAPGNSGGDSGRWYTDSELADIIGDDWFEDFDVSNDGFNMDAYGEKAKKNLVGYANAWFDDKGYNVNVLGVENNEVDHDLQWYIVGSFQNSGFAKKGMAEDDDAVAAFLARGGEVQRLKPAKPRKGERWQGSAHIGAAGGRGTKGRVSGLGANTGKSGKPVVTAEQGVSEVSLGDYRKKAAVNKAVAQANRFFDRDDPAKVAAADQTIAKREKGLARADARRKPYTPPAQDAEKMQRDLTARYPNIDELVAAAEQRRDPNYDYAEGDAYYRGREAEQNYQKLKQIQRVIQGLNESQAAANGPKTKELGTGTGRINPATGRPWTPSELKAKYAQPQPTAPTPDSEPPEPEPMEPKNSLDPFKAKRDAAARTAQLSMGDVVSPAPAPTEITPAPAITTPLGPPGFNAGNLAQLPGMNRFTQQPLVAPKPAANYGPGPAGYKSSNFSVGPTATKTTAAATPAGKTPAELQQDYYRALGLAEDLSWSKNFDPGRSLYRQMKK